MGEMGEMGVSSGVLTPSPTIYLSKACTAQGLNSNSLRGNTQCETVLCTILYSTVLYFPEPVGTRRAIPPTTIQKEKGTCNIRPSLLVQYCRDHYMEYLRVHNNTPY